MKTPHVAVKGKICVETFNSFVQENEKYYAF